MVRRDPWGELSFLQIDCKLRVTVLLVMSWVFVMGRWVVSPVSVGGGIVGDDDLLSGSVR